ncbi:MAG: patatin-like phospholipase family protein [Candidatus Marinimicrobia bacterium]|nr:patatin-like phospholipase family protein [Candidatus Neomarinimicrobiota bacterium]
MPRPTIGLALGGGGARGAAHIGVLQILDSENIPIDRIAGTSAGAIIGAMYSASLDTQWVEKRFREFLDSGALDKLEKRSLLADRSPDTLFSQVAKKVKDHYVIMMGLNRVSLLKKDKMAEALSFLIPVDSFEALKIPMHIIATDLQSTESVVYSSGDILEAIVQSSTIPGFIEPTISNEQMLVDGGVSMPIPVPVLQPMVDIKIAVDISRRDLDELKDPNMIDIMKRSETITSLALKSKLSLEADILIRPNVLGLHWSEFDQFDLLLENGQKATKDALNDIKKLIQKRSGWKHKFHQWLNPITRV